MSAQSPNVSVVMPRRNEINRIEATLASVLDQEVPEGAFEIIVVDGISDDGTREVLDRFSTADPRVAVVDNPQRITPCAMNAGSRAARGRYIAIMGAHNRNASDYLVRCLELAERTGADNVGGAVFAEAEGTWNAPSQRLITAGSRSGGLTGITPPAKVRQRACGVAFTNARSSTATVCSTNLWCATRTTS
jgi:glycosyltransferase involved in cell wall biosynthesis